MEPPVSGHREPSFPAGFPKPVPERRPADTAWTILVTQNMKPTSTSLPRSDGRCFKIARSLARCWCLSRSMACLTSTLPTPSHISQNYHRTLCFVLQRTVTCCVVKFGPNEVESVGTSYLRVLIKSFYGSRKSFSGNTRRVPWVFWAWTQEAPILKVIRRLAQLVSFYVGRSDFTTTENAKVNDNFTQHLIRASHNSWQFNRYSTTMSS